MKAEFLIGRKPQPVSIAECSPLVSGRTILVTGGAGFIGSAICRALARLGADRIVALDMAENSLAGLVESWQRNPPAARLNIELCDVRDLDRFRRMVRACRPAQIYHAAAYKHVPLLERMPFEAIENNALATWGAVCAAAEEEMERFVLVSSDKAAAAANVLGISKRLAEIFVTGIRARGSRFTAVRCGNVLGSPGSVLPRFLDQARRGAPLTVCDPAAERYFLTVEEAAHAVVMAAFLTQGGDIFIPEMGSPVRIADLARRVAGSHRASRIEWTGLRPGDQLQERLVSESEHAVPTGCTGLRTIRPHPLGERQLDQLASDLAACCRRRDAEALLDCVHRAGVGKGNAVKA